MSIYHMALDDKDYKESPISYRLLSVYFPGCILDQSNAIILIFSVANSLLFGFALLISKLIFPFLYQLYLLNHIDAELCLLRLEKVLRQPAPTPTYQM